MCVCVCVCVRSCWFVKDTMPEQCLHIKDERFKLVVEEYFRLSPKWHRLSAGITDIRLNNKDRTLDCEYCYKNHLLSNTELDGATSAPYEHIRVRVGLSKLCEMLVCPVAARQEATSACSEGTCLANPCGS